MNRLIRAYQDIQGQYLDQLYRCEHGTPEHTRWLTLYDGTVDVLATLCGKFAHASEVDAELWQTVSDLYKSLHGVRPRCHWSVENCRKWLAELRDEAESYTVEPAPTNPAMREAILKASFALISQPEPIVFRAQA